MNISKKTVTAGACGFALTMGIVIILVLLTMFLPFQVDPYIIFLLSLIVVFPLIWQRLNRLDGQKKILGWSFIGLGAQLLVLPLPLIIIILKFPSTAGFLFGGIILAGSLVLGVPAGLLTAAAGVFLIKRRDRKNLM
ncbi:MAG: hypothetical protein KKD46_06190 [Euryarchaeota archaeon]|nr:hypothetical protein [Euryarchaeota archaeon]MBU4340487.1 hypothetical protein [Euryarchaeota archaeon]MCG2735422.1 hypothetical protein [Candidatus Methanoperedenaceae archaeon]